ncbi:DUF4229 domain-containing protein [Arthrobacter halodurans]|uniref:DUF4229 domain-containing protein n=1 Tax=Arthrobacter halodurans TaxID=516699 RepID=A0ABV4UMJ2_9MICC
MQFFKYTVLRLALFFVVFVPLVWGLGWNYWLAAVVAAVVAFCVTYLFFNRLRLGAGEDLKEKVSGRGPRRKGAVELDDEAAEDRLP